MYHIFVFIIVLLPIHVFSVNIISRSEWEARCPKSSKALAQIPAPFVVVHHSETPSCNTLKSCKSRVKNIQEYHMTTRGWNDIGYNFLIGGDGNVYVGRGMDTWGAHDPNYNSKSIGICLIGSFSDSNAPEIQLNTLKELLKFGVEENGIREDYRLIGHRQSRSTSCPGDKLFSEIQSWPHFDDSIHR